MTQQAAVHAKIASFLGYSSASQAAVAAQPQNVPRGGQPSGRCCLTLYGCGYVPIRDSAANENTRLSSIAARKIPGLKVRYDGINSTMEIESVVAATYDLVSPAETSEIESEVIVYNGADVAQSLRRFRFAPQSQKWKLGLSGSGPILQVDADRNGTFEPSETVPPTHSIDGTVDVTPPRLAMTLSLTGLNAALEMNATDDGTSPTVRYQLNDGPVSVYSAPLVVPFREGQRVKAFAEDAAGNTSGLIETVISPKISVSNPSQNQVNLEWPISDAYTLEEATSLAGPWTEASIVIVRTEFRNSASIPAGADTRRFFRLRSRNVTK